MSGKWTKGEWKPYEIDGITHWPGIECGSTSLVVWGSQMENCGIQGDTLDEARANAHLIAAAPDLYEELENLVNAYQNYEDIGCFVMAAFDVLAKARGETQ